MYNIHLFQYFPAYYYTLTYFSIEKCRHPQDTGIFPLIGINQLLSNA